jgi:hypothetical protein
MCCKKLVTTTLSLEDKEKEVTDWGIHFIDAKL